jgi:hypothetical protein
LSCSPTPGFEGCTEALMLAHGFTAALLVDLVGSGLASMHTERRVGWHEFEVTRLQITEEGQQALKAATKP